MRHLHSFLSDKGHAGTQPICAIWAKKRADNTTGRCGRTRYINELVECASAALSGTLGAETAITEGKRSCELGEKIPPNYLPGPVKSRQMVVMFVTGQGAAFPTAVRESAPWSDPPVQRETDS